MKKFIRYLYEYQNGKRVQNVGFVKVNESDDSAVIQIYGKGFPAAGNQTLEILLFSLMGNQPVGISVGKVKGNQPMFGYRLEYTEEDVGGTDIFRNIEGIILLSCQACGNTGGGRGNSDNKSFRRWYGAVWNERSVDIEQMMRREEILRENDSAEPEQPHGEQEEDVPEQPHREQEEDVPEQPRGEQEEDMPEQPRGEQEENRSEMPRREWEDHPSEISSYRQETTSGEVPLEGNTPETTETSRDVIYKITRQDMAKLPRREWKLANNQFLLHGYRNYHHLVSFEKDGKCWLGVPGIYHPGEQRAASAFGFDQFMKPAEGEIELSEDEMNAQEDFGYWCRPVGAVIADCSENVLR